MGRKCWITTLLINFLVLQLRVREGMFTFAFGCKKAEQKALLKFKGSFYYVSADCLSSWKGQDCCKWEGVKCDNVTSHVVALDLGSGSSMNMLNAPRLDPCLLELTRLRHLDLSWNVFDSPIPDFIGSMSHLTYLNLSNARFSGVVTPHLGNLTGLQVLDLGYNFVTVNNLHWVSGLSALKYLDISMLNLTEAYSSMQALNKLPLLSELRLRGCKLGNAHLSNAFSNSTRPFSTLHLLDLSYNNFQGTLPHFFANLTSLRFLDLSFSKFDGSIPLWLLNMRALESLILRHNSFSRVEGGAVKNPCKLKVSNSSHNYVHGVEIPGPHDNLSKSLSNLENLDLSFNQLSGLIPESIISFQLRYLDLSSNSFEGSIPAALNNCTKLVKLDMGKNKLSGKLPSWSAQSHPSLQIIKLRANQLRGVIPQILFSLPQLQILDLAQNHLQGNIELTNLRGLQDLNLSLNHLFGNIPKDIGQMRLLVSLDLSNNHLSGTIPSSMSALTSLSYLDLSGNKLQGEIPTGKLQMFAPSIYSGNLGLCGYPLSNVCNIRAIVDGKEKDDLEKVVFYIVIMFGVVTGFWGVILTLLLKTGWRYALFKLVDDIMDYFYVQVMVRLNKMRNQQRTCTHQ